MKKEKISVIVAAFNTEKYIEKCLDSLINQTYKNIEIIVVEDCSTDNTKKVLEKYRSKENIKIIYNKVNMGAAYSRNLALKKSSGEYIGFIDSDDYVNIDYYEKLMNSIINNKSEIAICDMKIVDEKLNTTVTANCGTTKCPSKIDIINNGMAASSCNKLFKKDLIIKFDYPIGKMNEDVAVVIPAIVYAKKISYVCNNFYYYIQRENSTQNSKFSNKRFDMFDIINIALNRINKSEDYEIIKNEIVYNQIMVLLLYVIPKEKNIFKRYFILKKFNNLSKKYNIRQNPCFWQFLESCGRKHRIYYKLLLKLNCNGLYILSDLLILLYDFLSLLFKSKPVIKKKITIEDVIASAIKQNKMSMSDVKVSVVVPNYNYARFMNQRLYSILNQNYKIYELIILDDKSKDNSIDVINEIKNKISKFVTIKTIYNDENSGSAFKQWKKGFEYAEGNYVWIAEADDYCKPTLLKSLIKPIIKDDKIVISYSDTAFIDVNGNIVLKSIKPEIDIQKSGHWDKSYINNGINEITNYCFLNCTIANVSSCIIKNDNYSKFLAESGKFHQAGDWLFYVNAIKSGDISYTNKVLNYYRLHGDNVSSIMNHQKHVNEIKKIYAYYKDEFKLSKNHLAKMQKRIKFLKKCWKIS